MKRLGTKHTNILPLKQSNAISSPKEPFYKMRAGQHRHQCTPALGWWWGPDVATTPRYIFFFFCVKGFYLRALGVSAGLWQRLNFSLRNGEAKQTELSAFRSKLNRRTTVWPAVHNILFQHWLHLKQTLSRPIHLSQGERNLRKSLDLNSINKSAFSHYFFCCFSDRCFQVLGKCFHSLVTCVGVVPFDGMLGLSPRSVSMQSWVGKRVKRPQNALL